ncbi:hypothetical protein [Actinocorallia libanotica]|uniref:Uncharacterized protein n=1 Tax=Actinocorallia libanotica TaxID=46162 RepID=A0ABN1R6T2_9ACTN
MRSLRFPALLGCAALSAAILGLPVTTAQAREAADGTVRFSLEAEDQPRARRPELAKVKEKAEANGVSLGRQLKNEFGRIKKASGSDYPDVEIDGIHAMRFADFELISQNKGLTLEKVVEEYGWEDRFTELARYIYEKYPDTYAGYAIREVDGTRRGWVAFKGDVPQDVVEEAKKVPAPIDFEGRKGYSDKEVQAEVEKAAASLEDGDGTHEVSADPFTGEVQVNTEAAVEDHDEWLRGGGYLDKDMSTQCTAGFNIEKDGVYSPMTAGHCIPVGLGTGYPLTYQLHGGDGGSTTIVYSKLRHVGAYGDFSRFGPGKMKATDTFYENWSTKSS